MTDEPRAQSVQKGLDADRAPEGLTQDNAPQDGAPRAGSTPPGGQPESGTPATLEAIGAAARKAESSGAAHEAIERATAPNGKDAGE